MNRETLTLLTITLLLLFLIWQRADVQRRKAVRNFVVFMAPLLAIYVWWRGALRELFFAFVIALVANVLFWLLIGRYNPTSDSDDIRVMGLDD